MGNGSVKPRDYKWIHKRQSNICLTENLIIYKANAGLARLLGKNATGLCLTQQKDRIYCISNNMGRRRLPPHVFRKACDSRVISALSSILPAEGQGEIHSRAHPVMPSNVPAAVFSIANSPAMHGEGQSFFALTKPGDNS